MKRTHATTLDLYVSGFATEHTADCTFTFDPPSGDGWNEPHYGASVSLESVEVRADNGKVIDVLPLMSDKAQSQLEAEILAEVLESRREYSY